MVKRTNRTILTIVVAVVGVGSLFAVAFLLGGENLIQGNVSSLSLVENFRDLNCDAWNELAVTKNGVVSVVGSGREGFNPTFSSSFQTLTITDGTSEVDFLHIRLVMECSGNFIKKSSASVVSGSFNFQLCGDPQLGTTVCFQGSDRTFATLLGQATAIQTFSNVPIIQQPISDDQRVILFEGDISAFELERLFDAGDGRIFFKSTMLPVLTWTFNHPTLGIFTASYNAITQNDPIIAQYGALRVADVDTDGDGIFDLSDGCINQQETFNQFQDEDGCPDIAPIPDTDGDGILDDVDECVSLAENFNGFQDSDGCPDELPPPTQELIVIPDTDGDGVTDDIDLCITEVGTVANLGCPEVVIAEEPTEMGNLLEDDDGDGILNAIDSCPNEFGTLLNGGCPEVQIIVEPEPVVEPLVEPIEEIPEIIPSDEVGGVIPVSPVIPPPLFTEPEVPMQPTQPPTIVGQPATEGELTSVILLILFIGILIIITVAVFTRLRKR